MRAEVDRGVPKSDFLSIGKAAPEDKPDEEQFGYVDMVKVVGLRVVMD
jgi:hypothetical protein